MLYIFRRFGDMPAIAFGLLLLSIADMARAETACLTGDRSVGATFGSAEFFGTPWSHTWNSGAQTQVPAEGLRIRFGDTESEYMRGKSGGTADDLTTLHRALRDGPFTAARLRDGSVFIINEECRESWPLVRNDPTTPVALDDTVVPASEMECLSERGILTFEKVEVDENGFRLDDPIRQTGGWAMSWGPGEYVLGVNTWGDVSSFNTSDGICGSSSVRQ